MESGVFGCSCDTTSIVPGGPDKSGAFQLRVDLL